MLKSLPQLSRISGQPASYKCPYGSGAENAKPGSVRELMEALLHGLFHPEELVGESLICEAHRNVRVCVRLAWSCLTLCDPMDCSPLSIRFSRQEYWSGLSFPSPGDLPNPGIEPGSHALQEDSLPSEPPEKPTEN